MAFRREFKVGIFMLAALATIGIVIFLIGEERRAFSSKETYFSVFEDVQGLRRGSPVRMGGVDIGSVSDVSYGNDPKDAEIYVRMSIVASEAKRIRQDSVATIESKGLLGDKMIVITVGNAERPRLPPESKIPSKTADDMTAMIARLGAVSAQAERVMTNLERTTSALADESLHDDLKSGVRSLSHILGSLDRREGYVGKLLSDPAESERMSRVMANLERVTGELDDTARNVNEILARIEHGPGLVHEVIYGDDSSKAVAQFGQAAEEVGLTLRGIREGNGFARGLLYGGDPNTDQLVQNLNGASGDLRQIVADLKKGRGTLGALLVDPSLYEDLKMMLGNVDRNKALRALVRYSIRRDGAAAPSVHDPDANAPTRSAPTESGTQLGRAADEVRLQVPSASSAPASRD